MWDVLVVDELPRLWCLRPAQLRPRHAIAVCQQRRGVRAVAALFAGQRLAKLSNLLPLEHRLRQLVGLCVPAWRRRFGQRVHHALQSNRGRHGCQGSEGCYVFNVPGRAEVTDCLSWGTGTQGSSCTQPNDCFTGYSCASGTCRKVCQLGSSCATGTCRSVTGWTRFGLCL